MQDALEKLGFQEVSESLAKASGISHCMPSVNKFKSRILHGNLQEAIASFGVLAGNRLDSEAVNRVKCMITEEQYLEVGYPITVRPII